MEKEDIKLQDVESNTKCFKNIEIYPKNYREINEGDLLSLDERPVGDDNANHFKDEDICLKTHDRIEKEEVKMHDERPIGGGSNKKHFKDEDMYPKDYKETKETDVISSHDERPIGRGDNTNLFKDEDMYPKDYTQADQILKSNKKASRKPFLKKKGKNETDQTLENIDKYQETPPIINDKNLILPDESNNNNPNPPNFDERPLPSNKSFPNTADSSFKNAYEDNRPIGGGQKIPFDEPEFLDNNEGEIDKKTEEPLSNRIKSKIWKIRQEAFEELTQLFKNSSPSDEIFIEYSLSLPKLINDSNPASQEKALIAFQTYLEKCPSSKISNIDFCETVKTLIDKCLSPGKPTIKLISNEVLLSLFEKAETLNTTNLIFEGLISSFNNKNPKIVCSSIAAIQELLINYGPKKLIYLKPFFPEMEKMMASTTASIRNESFNFYKEAYKWLGESVLRPFLTNLKKVQIDELEKFFSENPPQKMIAKRLLPQINEVAQNPNGQSQEESIDPYEIADAVEVFQKFNEAFCDKVTGAAKWTEKKELLEEFHKAANVVKIVPNINSSNFSAIMALLKKLLNDNNINVVLISVKVIGVLAKGLRKNLNQNCKVFFPFLLEKVKDKKTSLVEEVKLTLDNFFYCLGIEDVLEELKEVLSDKGSPLVKMHALGWLDRFIDKKVEEGNKSNKFLIKRKDSFTELLPMMKKLSEDGNGEIRDAVLNTLGKIMAVYGEAFLGDFVSRLNNVKSQKLNDSANKMNVTKCNEKMVSNNNNSKANFNKFEENKNSEYDNDMHKNSNINNRPQTSNNNNKTSSHKILIKSTTQKALTSKTKDANPPSSTLKGKKTNNIQDSEESFLYISPEEADEILRPIFSESLFKSLDGSTWKEKFEGFQEINNNFFDVFKDSTLLEAFLISIKPRMKDWKESNLVLNKEFILLMQKVLSLPARPFNKKIFTLFAPYFIEKLIENKKYTDLFNEMIPIILECVNPKHVTMLLISNSGISDLSKKPNPKLLAELCLILNKMINLVTMTHCPLKSLLDFSKLCLNNTLQALRSNVIILLKTMYSFTGKELLKFIIDLNPQILKTVNSELEATAILKENEKIIKINFTGEFGLEQSDKVGSFLGKGCDNILDSMPRNDISAEVNKVFI